MRVNSNRTINLVICDWWTFNWIKESLRVHITIRFIYELKFVLNLSAKPPYVIVVFIWNLKL